MADNWVQLSEATSVNIYIAQKLLEVTDLFEYVLMCFLHLYPWDGKIWNRTGARDHLTLLAPIFIEDLRVQHW